jgi:hypothetical protein
MPLLDKLWIYDFRTNQNFTLKTRALTRADPDDFVTCYNPANRHERTETKRFHAFHNELAVRNEASLGVFWLRDYSLEDSENLLGSEIGVLGEDLAGRHAVRDHRHHRCDREAQAPDAGQAAHDGGIRCDAFVGHVFVVTVTGVAGMWPRTLDSIGVAT